MSYYFSVTEFKSDKNIESSTCTDMKFVVLCIFCIIKSYFIP